MDDEIKALLIEMRQYMIEHDVMMGECVAWSKLKKMVGIGIDQRQELEWLVARNPDVRWRMALERLDVQAGKR